MNTRNHKLLFLSIAFFVVGIFCLAPIAHGAPKKVILSKCSGSPSMGMEFYKGRLIAIVPFDYSNLRQGMLVARAVYDWHGKIVSYVAHRIVRRDGPLWIMQGSNMLTNYLPDPIRLNPDNFAGIVCDPQTLKPL